MSTQESSSGTSVETDLHVPISRPASNRQSFIHDGRIWTIALVFWANGVESTGVFTSCDCGGIMQDSVCVTQPFEVSCSQCQPMKRLRIPSEIGEKALKRENKRADAAWATRASTPLGPRGRFPI